MLNGTPRDLDLDLDCLNLRYLELCHDIEFFPNNLICSSLLELFADECTLAGVKESTARLCGGHQLAKVAVSSVSRALSGGCP